MTDQKESAAELKRILLIDDDKPLTNLMRMNLVRTGKFDVQVCNEAPEALKVARGFRPDIILLDLVMPGMDGGDVNAQLQQDPLLKDVPVLIVTALVSHGEASKDALVERGDQVMMAKPIRFDKLLHAIEDRLGGTQ
jgi:CheY-like chemotaxis protein